MKRPLGDGAGASSRGRPERTQSTEQDAALYDANVVPRYSAPFAQMILREIPLGTRATVLDVGCGTGCPAFDVLRRLGDGGRVVAIDKEAAFVEVARRRALDLNGRRLFFKTDLADTLHFGDQVFDFVVANLLLPSLPEPGLVLAEIRRVLIPGGRALLTRPLAGSNEEVLDCFRELALRLDRPELQQRADAVAARDLTAAQFAAQLRTARFDDVEIREEELRVSFRSAREMFADPLLRYIGLGEWRWVAGQEPGSERLLAEVERTLDTYFARGPLSLTVRAGLGIGRAL